MSDKDQSIPPQQPVLPAYYPMYLASKNDEIELFALLVKLWQKKFWIVSCMIVATLIAGIYAFTAKEQWTATAVIDVPGYDSISNYYEGVHLVEGNSERISSPDNVAEKLFRQFINQASSYNELSKFVGQSEYFKRFASGKNTDEMANLLNELVDNISFTKEKDSTSYIVKFPASEANSAQKLLENYMRTVNGNVGELQYNQLTLQIKNKIISIKNQMDTLKVIAEEKRQAETKNIKMALVIAEKSNIKRPELNGLTRIDNSNLFLLGNDALKAMLDNIEKQPLVLTDGYYDLQRQYINLESFNINRDKAQAFAYLKSPAVPLVKDKPKKLLILLSGMIIGLFISIGYFLGKILIVNYNNKS
ncbi:Wzz/FepE/Etk N-terminal domain-containing protein [Jinshanibacter sp. LJY008]|uniref:Wzz/FepE/Etk N-terminal domain-containing protein n=1 Tax=Limnobaculum eriocheiris TaxID=2897391 RepID=A0A9X1MW26_9GAMM|nr:Wzz/FepE/Etk N-terminal domain-containing protein [Limnobaculum eriocheiris]MCD1124782.1 Wzz/FepE/Etk N-terminal domain-containing protein [Limnobaculum eriocheiris]